MSISGKEKSEIHERGQQWAKEESKEDCSPIHLRPIGQILFDLDGGNKERRDAFQAGVDNYNKTIACNKADSFSFVPESWIKDRSSDTENTYSESDGDSSSVEDSSFSDDSPTNHTSSTPVYSTIFSSSAKNDWSAIAALAGVLYWSYLLPLLILKTQAIYKPDPFFHGDNVSMFLPVLNWFYVVTTALIMVPFSPHVGTEYWGYIFWWGLAGLVPFFFIK